MTEELAVHQDVQKWTLEEKEAAAQTNKELNSLLDDIQSREKELDSDFVKLGTLVNEVQGKKYWLLYGDYRSFNAWLKSIEPKVNKGRSRIYASLGIAKQLLPYIAPKELENMGISKASALATAVKKSGKPPADELLNAIKDKKTTLEQTHELIADNYGARDEFEMGIWYNLHGVYMSLEEKEEFERCVAVACKSDPPLPYLISWQDATAPQRKEILWRLVATFLADQEAEVNAQSSIR